MHSGVKVWQMKWGKQIGREIEAQFAQRVQAGECFWTWNATDAKMYTDCQQANPGVFHYKGKNYCKGCGKQMRPVFDFKTSTENK